MGRPLPWLPVMSVLASSKIRPRDALLKWFRKVLSALDPSILQNLSRYLWMTQLQKTTFRIGSAMRVPLIIVLMAPFIAVAYINLLLDKMCTTVVVQPCRSILRILSAVE